MFAYLTLCNTGRTSGERRMFNLNQIVTIHRLQKWNRYPARTRLVFSNNETWYVAETPREIDALHMMSEY